MKLKIYNHGNDVTAVTLVPETEFEESWVTNFPSVFKATGQRATDYKPPSEEGVPSLQFIVNPKDWDLKND